MSKQTLIFFSVILTLLVVEYFVLRVNFQRNYSDQKLNNMITASSSLKDVTPDPCKYSILGEPPLAPNQYLKLHLYCPGGKSLNTLDPRAVKVLTFKGALEELGNINGFTLEFKNDLLSRLGNLSSESGHSWTCLANSAPIKDYNQTISIPNTITCTYE